MAKTGAHWNAQNVHIRFSFLLLCVVLRMLLVFLKLTLQGEVGTLRTPLL
jgi:hypothetical protein